MPGSTRASGERSRRQIEVALPLHGGPASETNVCDGNASGGDSIQLLGDLLGRRPLQQGHLSDGVPVL